MKVFLGGTCNGPDWRSELIKELHIDYFNPVVEDWTPKDVEVENREKEICDIHLFVINKEMTGVYSIAEMIDSSNKCPNETILHIDYDGFDEGQRRSLKAVEEMAGQNGAIIINDFKGIVTYLNERGINSENNQTPDGV